MQFDISTFGEILIDFTFSGVNEDGVALFAQNPGGAPGNVAVAAQKLGSSAAFLGKAGNDMHGRYLKDVLDAQHVNTDGLVLSDDFFTTLAFVSLNEDGERTFSFARKPGADTQMALEDFNLDIVRSSKIFHVGSLSLTDEPAKTTTFEAVKEARKAGVIVSYDPNYRDSLWSSEQAAVDAMRSLVPYADLMKISDEETGLLSGIRDPKEAAQALLGQGVKIVVVTLGGEGALVASAQGSVHVPGFKSKVADTTGAGDSFWAGFLHCLAHLDKKPSDMDLNELAKAARFGNAVASLCVEGKGAIPAMPSLEEVEKRLAS